jgi:hypothetical protein
MTWSARQLVRKLKGRSAAEFRERGGQAWASACERVGLRDQGELSPAVVERKLGAAAGPSPLAWPLAPRFFASFDDLAGTLAAIARHAPSSVEALLARADAARSGTFTLLGYGQQSFGSPIDWSLDPVTGVRTPDLHWSRVEYLDHGVAGDHKLVWELNRHQHLIALAVAAHVRPDGGYDAAAELQLNDWMNANPPKKGVNWASSLEVALRAIAWIWTMALLGDRLSRATRCRMAGFLWYAGRHIERYLSTYFSPNTHLTGEALGLFYIGTMLPGFAESPRWRDRGGSILLEWLPRHVRRDGTYVEQSTWYHRYTVDFYTNFALLARRTGLDVRDRVFPVLEQMLEFLAAVSRPDGSMPLIGDDDGGKLLSLDERTAHDVRTPLAMGALLFRRADFAGVAGPLSAEPAWLLGASCFEEFGGSPRAIPSTTSRAFNDGGYYILRDGWGADASIGTIDCGPHAFLNGGHAHADVLAIDLVLGGEKVFVDPGTFTYTSDPAWRDRFRATASHSAVTIDGASSSEMAGAFQWASMARERALAWSENATRVLFSGSHDGFSRLVPPASYERSVVLVHPSLWIIRDEIESTDVHDIGVHFQCAPGLTVALADASSAVIHREERVVAHMVTLAAGGHLELSEGWVSGTYGERTRAPHLCLSARGSRQSVTTFVVAGAAGPLDVRLVPAGATEAFSVRAGDEEYAVSFAPGGAVECARLTPRRAGAADAGDGASTQWPASPSAAGR